jgi:hypothetical protein
MTAQTQTTTMTVAADPNAVPDYTSKAKERRASEKPTLATHQKHRSEIVDYAPPCIPKAEGKAVPRGSVVGHYHSPSLIAAWKHLDEIY